MSGSRERLVGPFCVECGADTKGDPAVCIPAPKQGGPFYKCRACSPAVSFLSFLAADKELDGA